MKNTRKAICSSVSILIATFLLAATAPVLSQEPLKNTELDQEVADAITEATGVKTDKSDLEKKEAPPLPEDLDKGGFGLGALNPMKIFYGPVTKMQETIVRLEQQIMRLEGPIAAMEKPLLSLRKDVRNMDRRIVDVNSDLAEINKNISSTEKKISEANKSIVDTKNVMAATKDQLANTKNEVVKTNSSIKTVHKSMGKLHNTIGTMEDKLGALDTNVKELREPVEQLPKPVRNLEGHLNKLESDLGKLRESVDRTSNIILLAIICIGLLICIGTPVFGLLAYKYRNTILEALDSKVPNNDSDNKSMDAYMEQSASRGSDSEKEHVHTR